MTNLASRDFASLLDDLVAASAEKTEDSVAPPSIPFDYLAVADELHSGRVTVADDVVAAEYGDTSSEDFATFLSQAAEIESEESESAAAKLSIEPEMIAGELELDRSDADFGQIRRRFAFANHPDRVPVSLRERALIRMQVANMLIDSAERLAAPMPTQP